VICAPAITIRKRRLAALENADALNLVENRSSAPLKEAS